jgi:hypothetical protein
MVQEEQGHSLIIRQIWFEEHAVVIHYSVGSAHECTRTVFDLADLTQEERVLIETLRRDLAVTLREELLRCLKSE